MSATGERLALKRTNADAFNTDAGQAPGTFGDYYYLNS